MSSNPIEISLVGDLRAESGLSEACRNLTDALARHGVTIPGLRAGVLWGAWFGSALLLAFLKPPFGPILLVEKVHPRALLYPPGLTAEQWLCVFAAGALAWQSVRIMRASWRQA